MEMSKSAILHKAFLTAGFHFFLKLLLEYSEKYYCRYLNELTLYDSRLVEKVHINVGKREEVIIGPMNTYKVYAYTFYVMCFMYSLVHLYFGTEYLVSYFTKNYMILDYFAVSSIEYHILQYRVSYFIF